MRTIVISPTDMPCIVSIPSGAFTGSTKAGQGIYELMYLSHIVADYEDEIYPTPETTPAEIIRVENK